MYKIELVYKGDWYETYWHWNVKLDGLVLAEGNREYRFAAKWAAQKAARRHAKGLPAVKPGKSPENEYYYTPE